MGIPDTLTQSVLGLLSFVFLIAWLRWAGPLEDQKSDGPRLLVPKESELQTRNELDLIAAE
jgi:hypothetical protein